jgi:hypothetical protein
MGSLDELMDSKSGSILISILLGLGLAALFRQACKDKQCIVVKGPNVEEIAKYYYKIDQDCFKYTPVVTECASNE